MPPERLLVSKYTRNALQLGAADPAGGAYSALPADAVGFRGRKIRKGRKRRKDEGNEGKWRGGKGVKKMGDRDP